MSDMTSRGPSAPPISSDGGKAFPRQSTYGLDEGKKDLNPFAGGYADGTTLGVNPDTDRVKHS